MYVKTGRVQSISGLIKIDRGVKSARICSILGIYLVFGGWNNIFLCNIIEFMQPGDA
ncbi:unnamed protein product, partial [Rotaria magnacalcarata]